MKTHRVVLLESGAVFETGPGEPLLAAALRQGVPLPHECTFGGCGTCRIKLVEGSVDYEEMPLALSAEEAAQGFALACQARACGDLVISAGTAQDDLPPAQRCGATVDALNTLTPDIANLRLALDCDAVDYAPGQYMNVILEDGSHRSFSMASLPAGNRVDFHVRRIPGGRFTDRQLSALRVGDRLEVELPLGIFRYHAEDYRPLVMVANGTGLAPIKSILESLMDDPDCPPVSLYWGMRTQPDLYLAAEIARWGERLYDFRFVPALSRAGADWSGRRGHVQEAVIADLPDLSEHAIYICGSPAMISDAKRGFLAHGASLAHLYTDGFAFHHEATA
jgi:CDP-4-dehydro-6-deoxyglucose reductase